ncbi:MAG: hypothetical protein R2822_20450 [Spirosomataceae bacterium]
MKVLVSVQAQQIEIMSLREMVTQKIPSSQKIYHITDEGKQGDWKYDAQDTQSQPNIGTILESSHRENRGGTSVFLIPKKA